jgi:hypothetical protein
MAGALAMLRRESRAHDLVLARVPSILADQAGATDFLRLPWLVDMWARAAEVAKRRQRGRGTVASAYARWKQQGFTAARGETAADLARFYETMYLPFARARFGDAASTLDRATLRRALDRGTVLWVELDGRPVAGQLLERSGDALHTVAVGTSLAPEAAQATGVLTALKVAACELALAEGLEWIDFGGCMPWLTDGVLQNKRQWGAELVHRGGLHRALLATWARWTPAAAALLAQAPICRHGTATIALTTTTPRGNQDAAKLLLPGLDRLVVVEDGAARVGAVPSAPQLRRVAPADTAAVVTQGWR